MISSDALDGASLSFIGCGVMAEAMIAGLLSKNLVEPEQVVGSHPRADRRDELQAKYGIRLFESNREAAVYHSTRSAFVGGSTSALASAILSDQAAFIADDAVARI